MNLNKMIPKVGSAIVTVTVFLFALFIIINYSMGSFFVCLILPIGFIMMTAGLHNEQLTEQAASSFDNELSEDRFLSGVRPFASLR
jgi:uncharacterized membrane protein